MPWLNKRKLSKEERSEKRRQYNSRHYEKSRRVRSKEKERRVPFSCRLPEQLLAILQRITLEGLATGKYPYQNVGEAVADVLRKGLGTLRDQDEMIEAIWPGLQVAHQLDQVASIRRQAQVIVNRLHEEVSELLAIGAKQEALQYFWGVMDQIKKMPATAHRDHAIKRLERDFPKFAKEKRVPGVRLVVK